MTTETKYEFKANKDVLVSIDGEYSDGSYDVFVHVHDNDNYQEFTFEAIDDAELVIRKLFEFGVRWHSLQTLWYNQNYIQSVLFDHDATENSLLRELRHVTEEKLQHWAAIHEYNFEVMQEC